MAPCRCWTGTVKTPTKCLWRLEPDRRYKFFFSQPAHLCRHIYNWNIVACDVKHQYTQCHSHSRVLRYLMSSFMQSCFFDQAGSQCPTVAYSFNILAYHMQYKRGNTFLFFLYVYCWVNKKEHQSNLESVTSNCACIRTRGIQYFFLSLMGFCGLMYNWDFFHLGIFNYTFYLSKDQIQYRYDHLFPHCTSLHNHNLIHCCFNMSRYHDKLLAILGYMLTRHNQAVARNTTYEEVSRKVNEYSVSENTL